MDPLKNEVKWYETDQAYSGHIVGAHGTKTLHVLEGREDRA